MSWCKIDAIDYESINYSFSNDCNSDLGTTELRVGTASCQSANKKLGMESAVTLIMGGMHYESLCSQMYLTGHFRPCKLSLLLHNRCHIDKSSKIQLCVLSIIVSVTNDEALILLPNNWKSAEQFICN
jgi:hypothetical protein